MSGRSSEAAWLKEQIQVALGPRRGLSWKRMFGCDAAFRDGRIFTLVWREGRIAVKLPDEAAYAELAAVAGVDAWAPGGKGPMRGWLMVPPAWNESEDRIGPWLERAFASAAAAAAATPRSAVARAKRPVVKEPAKQPLEKQAAKKTAKKTAK